MAKKFFFKGEFAKYNAEQHSNGFYIATDTSQLIAGGITVGINPELMLAILAFMDSKGKANGLATLDENGKIPVSLLNGDIARVQGVDAVATSVTLPAEDLVDDYTVWCTDTKVLKIYTLNTTSWRDVAPAGDTIYSFRNSDATGDTGRTNILYRWDGADMVEISESLAIGETTGTAYEGSKGKANAEAITALQGRMDAVEANKVTSDQVKTQIESYITQELGQETLKVISLKVVSDYINLLTDAINQNSEDIQEIVTKIGTPSDGDTAATGMYKVIEDNKSAADAAIASANEAILLNKTDITELKETVGETSVAALILAAINALKDGVSTEYDTLKKIEDMLKLGDADSLSSANTYTDESLLWYDVE